MTPQTLARIAQLTQKTNQFNLTTRRYTEQQLADMSKSPEWQIYALNSADRFGDNGLVGVAILHITKDQCEIDTLLLSCRVIGRTIETAMLAVLADHAKNAGATRLIGKFIPTKKNVPAKDFYAAHHFMLASTEGTTQVWTAPLDGSLPAIPPWVQILS
jgi:FkbH-like protein